MAISRKNVLKQAPIVHRWPNRLSVTKPLIWYQTIHLRPNNSPVIKKVHPWHDISHMTKPFIYDTSTIVQFIFHFWSYEFSEHILRNQKLLTGLDSYSRQLFIYLDPNFIYISLWIDCVFEIHKFAVCFPLAFVARSLQGHWWEFIIRNCVVWPIHFL